MRPELGIDPICEHQPEKKRHDDARVADDERLARFTAHDAQIELHTDHEHEQHQADLADHVQRHERRRLEQELERAGKEMAQHGRPQHDSGHDLADHAGLTEILEQIGKDPDGNQNRYDLQQQQRHRVRQVRRQSLAPTSPHAARQPRRTYRRLLPSGRPTTSAARTRRASSRISYSCAWSRSSFQQDRIDNAKIKFFRKNGKGRSHRQPFGEVGKVPFFSVASPRESDANRRETAGNYRRDASASI